MGRNLQQHCSYVLQQAVEVTQKEMTGTCRVGNSHLVYCNVCGKKRGAGISSLVAVFKTFIKGMGEFVAICCKKYFMLLLGQFLFGVSFRIDCLSSSSYGNLQMCEAYLHVQYVTTTFKKKMLQQQTH